MIDVNQNSFILNALLEKGLYLEDEKQLNHYAGDYGRLKNIPWKEVKRHIIRNIEDFLEYIVNRVKYRFGL